MITPETAQAQPLHPSFHYSLSNLISSASSRSTILHLSPISASVQNLVDLVALQGKLTEVLDSLSDILGSARVLHRIEVLGIGNVFLRNLEMRGIVRKG